MVVLPAFAFDDSKNYTMDEPNLQEIHDLLVEIALEAGRIQLSARPSTLEIDTKKTCTPSSILPHFQTNVPQLQTSSPKQTVQSKPSFLHAYARPTLPTPSSAKKLTFPVKSSQTRQHSSATLLTAPRTSYILTPHSVSLSVSLSTKRQSSV